jgi:hypothetical protein
MGLPEGWGTVTEGLSRVGQLRVIGNSVCPRRSVHALEILHDACKDIPPQ